MFKKAKVGLLALVGALASVNAMAGDPGLDYSDLTDAINFDDVGPAVMTGAGALVALYVIIKGIKLIISFVRS